jgi:hypothetical protein
MKWDPQGKTEDHMTAMYDMSNSIYHGLLAAFLLYVICVYLPTIMNSACLILELGLAAILLPEPFAICASYCFHVCHLAVAL